MISSRVKKRGIKEYLNKLRIDLVDTGVEGGLEPYWRPIEGNAKAFLLEPDGDHDMRLKSVDYIEKYSIFG